MFLLNGAAEQLLYELQRFFDVYFCKLQLKAYNTQVSVLIVQYRKLFELHRI